MPAVGLQEVGKPVILGVVGVQVGVGEGVARAAPPVEVGPARVGEQGKPVAAVAVVPVTQLWPTPLRAEASVAATLRWHVAMVQGRVWAQA